ncbi:hypothetical protein FE784_36130 [Paenibacillus hemerocallicola]|uniref:Uncharacterized protein n=1 Tax=Paenibacillus hemerocallicola TaxID=1172614 RepID=A0A5C4SXK3_9BACL|nr:hypothetical protein [Paenibacillus hemerocallicola]TNJ60297.1 hypothetical protein FE784_36130 [Paenibacillus hemerocallicola]
MAACRRTGGSLADGSLADGLRRRQNESGNKADEATGQAPEQKQPMDLVFYSSPGDFDEASFMARFGDKIHEKFPYITPNSLSE